MSFYKEMHIANHAKLTGGEDDYLLANAIFAYVLWFFLDYGLDDGEAGGGWYGELYLETNDPDRHTADQVRDETFVLVLFKRGKNGEDRFADCVSIPAHLLNPTAMSRAFGQADLIERKVFLPTFVLENGRTVADLWQEFFSLANDYFADPENPGIDAFEEILTDILDPEVKKVIMQELRKHLANFKW